MLDRDGPAATITAGAVSGAGRGQNRRAGESDELTPAIHGAILCRDQRETQGHHGHRDKAVEHPPRGGGCEQTGKSSCAEPQAEEPDRTGRSGPGGAPAGTPQDRREQGQGNPRAGTRRFWDADKRLPCGPTPWGELVGVDVNTGKIAWRTTMGVTDDFPDGMKDTGRPGLGGAITTASGLTFVAATDDARFRAFETRTGKQVWETRLPASGYATPVTYEAKGRQYLAIMATGGSQIGAPLLSDTLVVFALPK